MMGRFWDIQILGSIKQSFTFEKMNIWHVVEIIILYFSLLKFFSIVCSVYDWYDNYMLDATYF